MDLILDMNRNSYLYIPLNTIGNWQIFNLIKINILSDKNAMLNFAAKSEAKTIFNGMVY